MCIYVPVWNPGCNSEGIPRKSGKKGAADRYEKIINYIMITKTNILGCRMLFESCLSYASSFLPYVCMFLQT